MERKYRQEDLYRGPGKEAEEAAARGEMSVVFKITKHICGNNIDPYAPVKDENDTVLIIERLTTQNQMNWSTPQ